MLGVNLWDICVLKIHLRDTKSSCSIMEWKTIMWWSQPAVITFALPYKDFDNYRQFIAYVRLCPVHRQSGTSVRERRYFSKKGNKMLRNHLFLCSFTACQYNPQCKALYDRLVAKGKSKKLALIAVCNKLIKQSFGIIKNDLVYDPKYKSNLMTRPLIG